MNTTNTRQLGYGVELVKTGTFWPEGQWSIVRDRGEQVWSKRDGWKKYYDVQPGDRYFKTAEEAMQAWQRWSESKST